MQFCKPQIPCGLSKDVQWEITVVILGIL